MRNLALGAVIFLCSALALPAQQTQQTAQQFNVAPTNQAPNVTNASAVSDFEAGSTTRFYWIITQLGGVTSTPIQTSDTKGPVSLSSSNGGRITVTWTTPSPTATFDVLESSTSTLPASADCHCAVAIGVSGNSVTDIGTYQSYNTTYVLGFSWNVVQSVNAGVPNLDFYYNGLLVCNFSPTGSGAGCANATGGVTEISLTEPSPVFNPVTNSPCTGPNCDLHSSFATEPPNTVFAGPTPNGVGGVLDARTTSTSSGYVSSITNSLIVPSNNDFAFLLGQSNFPSCTTPITSSGTGTWTDTASAFSLAGGLSLFTQQVSAGPLTGTQTCATPIGWSSSLFTLKTTGTPTFPHHAAIGGAFGTGANTLAIPGSVTSGDAIMFVIYGLPVNIGTWTVSDTLNNKFTPVALSQNTTQSPDDQRSYVIAFLSTGVTGGSDTINFKLDTGGIISANAVVMEVSNIALTDGTPGFIPATNLASAFLSNGFSLCSADGTTPSGTVCEWNGTAWVLEQLPIVPSQIESLIITSGICTTGGAEQKCPMSAVNWPVAFSNSTYAVTCTVQNPTGSGDNPSLAVYWTAKSASAITLELQSGSNSAGGTNTTAEIDCTGVHQ